MNSILELFLGGLVSWKTTLTGVIGGVVLLLNHFGIAIITPEQQGALIIVILMVIGWFAKDATATGSVPDNVNNVNTE